MPTFEQVIEAAKKLPKQQPTLDWKPTQPLAYEDKAMLGLPASNPDPTANWDYKTAELGPNNEAKLQGQQGWTPDGERYFGGDSDLANWFNGLMARIRAPLEKDGVDVDYDSVSSLDPSKIIETTKRATGEVIMGTLGLLNVGSEAVERFRSGLAEAASLPSEASPVEWGWFNWARDIIENVARVPAEVGGGVAAFLTNPEQAAKDFGEGWHEGRIYYSNIGDPVRQAEYNRRLNSGENPYLLSKELAEPVNEMFGQIIFDPTWLAGIVLKPLREAGTIANIEKRTAMVADDAIRAELKAAKAATQGGKIFDTAEAGAKLESLIAKRVERNGILPKVFKTADSRLFAVERGKFGIPRFFSPRTPGSMKNLLTQDFAAIFGNIFRDSAGSANKIDDAVSMTQALVKTVTSTDKLVVEEGLKTLERMGFPIEVAMSEAGERAGAMMGKILELGDVKIMEELRHATTGADILTSFGGLMDKAADLIYPSNLDLTGLSGLARKALDTPFYKKSYEFFGSVYMSNPAFVARSFGSDIIALTTDAGAGSLRGLFHISSLDDNIAKMFGHIPPGYAEGFTATGAKFSDDVGRGFFSKWTSKVRNVSAKNQQNISKIAFHHGARRFMEQGYMQVWKNSIPALANADDFTDEMATALKRYLKETGSPAKAKELLLADIDRGYIEGKRMTWLSDVLDGTLDDYGFGVDWRRGVNASSTLDEALAAHDEVLESFLAQARKAGTQEQGLHVADDVMGHGEAILNAAAEGLTGETSKAMHHFRSVANKEIEFQAGELFGELGRIAKGYGVDDIRNLVPDNLKGITRIDGEWLAAERLKLTKRHTDSLAMYRKLLAEQSPDLKNYWEKLLRLDGELPAGATKDTVIRYFWEHYYHATSNDFADLTVRYMENVADALSSIEKSGAIPDALSLVRGRVEDLRAAVELAGKRASQSFSRTAGTMVENGNLDDVMRLAIKNGVRPDDLLATINKNLPEGVEKFTDEALIPYELAEEALRARALKRGVPLNELGTRLTDGIPALTDEIAGISRRNDGGHIFTPNRMLAEQERGIRGLFDQLREELVAKFEAPIPTNPRTLSIEAALGKWEEVAAPATREMQIMAEKYGTAMRDLTVLPYATGKTNLDSVMSLIYPYSFWPTRTYANWGRRIAANPALLGAYGRYRETMKTIHKDSPDWYKNSLRSDEMFGLFPDNPIFFNLESQFNPLEGLVGVDFNDPQKRVNWWTTMIDDMGKWGSSPWAFINIAAAIVLKAQGDDDAAARWAGRLGPQSQWIRGAVSLATGGETVLDLDPLTFVFGNGKDPYVESSGIPRAFAQMELDGKYSHDQLLEAAAQQSGPIWEEAYRRAIHDRAPGNVISAFVGGVRPRTIADLQADEFYNAMSGVFAQRDYVSSQQYQQLWNKLRQVYPFGDAMLLAKKAGDDKDEALAWNVLARIPPSQSDNAAAAVGISPELIKKFYNDKGDLGEWSESDHMRFMAGIIDLQAIVATPSDATRQEWTEAKTAYAQVDDALMAQFGEDILTLIDAFFVAHNKDKNIRPSDVVGAALDLKSKIIAETPILTIYYGGINAVSKYYESLMYNDLGEKYPNANALLDEYYSLSSGQRSRFVRNNAELKGYFDTRDEWRTRIDNAILKVGGMLPEGQTQPSIRPDYTGEVPQGLLAPQVDLQQALSEIGPDTADILLDYLSTGEPMSSSARSRISDAAASQGISYYELLQELQRGLADIIP